MALTAPSTITPICGGLDIHEQTYNELHCVFNTISEGNSASICREAIPDEGNNFYAGFPGSKFSNPKTKISIKVASAALGEEVAFGGNGPRFEASKKDFEFAKTFVVWSEKYNIITKLLLQILQSLESLLS